jgi:hypothetical protein
VAEKLVYVGKLNLSIIVPKEKDIMKNKKSADFPALFT